MSDFARLEEKLAKLSQRERIAGEGRRLRGATPEARLAALVTEIDETVLPRRLSFAVEGGPTVHLAVANRRLQALVSPAPDVAGADASALADRPLPDAEDEGVPELKKLLLAAFAGGGAISIRSARPKVGFPSDVGVPAGILARVWAVAEVVDEPASPEAVLSEFLGGLGSDVAGWLRIEGENVTDQGGEPSVVEALGDHAAVFLDSYFGKFDILFPNEGGACGTLAGPVTGTGLAALFVEIGEVSAFIAAKADRAVHLATRWQALAGA